MTFLKTPTNPGEFELQEFGVALGHLPELCPLVGTQAVAFRANHYEIVADDSQPITSENIQFWGGRDEMFEFARSLRRKAIIPPVYEMTVWSGAVELEIAGKQSLAFFLHTVPGLGIVDPAKAALERRYQGESVARNIHVLTPVLLVMSTLHSLRHLSQQSRKDENHLRVCLKIARRFLEENLRSSATREVIWNSERIISTHRLKPYRKLEAALGFNLLDAVPIEEMKRAAESGALAAEDAQRLDRFLTSRWPQVLSETDSPADTA